MSESYYLRRELPPEIAKPRLPRVECTSMACESVKRNTGGFCGLEGCFCQCHLPRKATK